MNNKDLMQNIKCIKINHNQRNAIFFLAGITLVSFVVILHKHNIIKKHVLENQTLHNDISEHNLTIQKLISKVQRLNNNIENNNEIKSNIS